MKHWLAYLSFCFINTVISFADIKFTSEIEKLLTERAQKNDVGYRVDDAKGIKLIRRLLKKRITSENCSKVVSLYAKILFENKDVPPLCASGTMIISELLMKIESMFLIWHNELGMTNEEASSLSQEFRKTKQLIDPFYH